MIPMQPGTYEYRGPFCERWQTVDVQRDRSGALVIGRIRRNTDRPIYGLPVALAIHLGASFRPENPEPNWAELEQLLCSNEHAALGGRTP